jgi:hypothetical protein
MNDAFSKNSSRLHTGSLSILDLQDQVVGRVARFGQGGLPRGSRLLRPRRHEEIRGAQEPEPQLCANDLHR